MKFFIVTFCLIIGAALAVPFTDYSKYSKSNSTKNSYNGTNQWGTQYQRPSGMLTKYNYTKPSVGQHEVPLIFPSKYNVNKPSDGQQQLPLTFPTKYEVNKPSVGQQQLPGSFPSKYENNQIGWVIPEKPSKLANKNHTSFIKYPTKYTSGGQQQVSLEYKNPVQEPIIVPIKEAVLYNPKPIRPAVITYHN